MLSNEMSEIDEMALFLQDLAAEFCLRHLTVKMLRHSAVKCPENHVSIAEQCWRLGNQQDIFIIVAAAVAEDLGKKDLNLNDIEDVTFLPEMA
jgi:hypothetical protein